MHPSVRMAVPRFAPSFHARSARAAVVEKRSQDDRLGRFDVPHLFFSAERAGRLLSCAHDVTFVIYVLKSQSLGGAGEGVATTVNRTWV